MTQLLEIHPAKTRAPHHCTQCDSLIPAGSVVNAQSVPASGKVYQTGKIYTKYWCQNCMEVKP